jgi:hypothetical protein
MRLRLVLHTALYLCSVAAVLASAMNPVGTARFLRRHSGRVVSAVRSVADSTASPVAAASGIKARPGDAQTRPRDLRRGEYRVPIGAALSARLRTPIDSRTIRANDQIDATLTDAVSQDGVELIPVGSILHGTIVDARPASREMPLGRVEMIFTVVQHAETRSRAAIRTRTLTIDADPPAAGPTGRRPSKPQPIDVVLNAGHPLTLTLSEPLLVYVAPAR